MLNIAPLDFERYAVLYGPPPPQVASSAQAADPQKFVTKIEPIISEFRRRSLKPGGKIKTSDFSLARKTRETDKNDPEHPLNGPFPTDLRAFFKLSDNFKNSTPVQLGITPEKVAGLFFREI